MRQIVLATDRVAADAAETFAERTDDDVDLIFDAGRFGETAPVFAEHAERMRFVDEQRGAVARDDFADLDERRGVAEHAVDAFDDDERIRPPCRRDAAAVCRGLPRRCV